MPSQKDKNKNILVRVWLLWEKLIGNMLSPLFVRSADKKTDRQSTTTTTRKASFFAKRKFLLFSSLSFALLATLASLAFFYQSEAGAAWFNDNWQYRQKVTFGNSGAAVTSARKVKYDVDTSTLISAGQLQSDCDDLRFTDVNGKLLEYYIDSAGGACNTASTDVYILVVSVPTGTNVTYMYYGNPSALAGTAASQFSDSTFSPTSGPTFGSAEASEGPVAYWKFDTGAGTTAQDTTQSANDATVTNATWKDESFCKAGRCLEFDGDGDYATLADDADVDFAASDDFTISGWFRHGPQSSGQDVLIAKTNTTAGYKVLMESDGDITFAIDDDATWTPDDSATSTTATYDDNAWHHFAAVKDGITSITLYIDGQQVAQDASIAATGTLANSADFYIGIDGDGAANDWDGFIDEVKVYRYARSEAQVKLDSENPGSASGAVAVLGASSDSFLSDGLIAYWPMDETSGNRSDFSGNNHTLTDTNTVGSAIGKYSNSADFESSNNESLDIASFSGLSNSTAFTWTGWLNTESAATSGALTPISIGTTSELLVYITRSSNNIFVRAFRGSGSTYITGSYGFTSDGNWVHATIVYDGTLPNDQRLKIYKNAELDTEAIVTGTVPTTFSSGSKALSLGKITYDSSNKYDGLMDEVRLYNRALSSQEIHQLYIHTPGPVLHYDLENTDTSENLDQSNTTGDTLIFSGSDEYQSFTAGASGELTSFDWYNTVGSDCDSTVHLREGTGTGGTSLANQAIQQRNSGWETFTFSTPGTVSSGSTYSLHFDITDCHVGEESNSNPYAGGRNSNSASNDYEFRTYVSSTGLADLSGNGNLASIDNFSGTYEVKGKYGFAYDFDGSDDSLAIATASDSYVDFNSSESFSGSAWVKVETMPGSSNQDAIITKWDETSTLRGYRLVVENDDADSTGNFQVEIYDESADQTITASGANDTVNQGEWYYIHFTFNGGTAGSAGDLKLYVNGLLVDSNAANGSFLGLEDVAADFSVGNYDSTDVVANNTVFDGIIDDVKVFWYQSPTRDIISAYNGGHPLGGSPIASQVGYWSLDEQQGQNVYDRGYGENTGVLGASSTASTDDPTWNTPANCKVNGCADFDGGDAINIGDIEMDSWTELTVTTWLKTTTTGSNIRLISKDQVGTAGNFILWQKTANYWNWQVYNGSTWIEAEIYDGTLADGNWHHLAGVVDTDQDLIYLYIDGKERASASFTASSLDDSDSEEIVIGADSDVAGFDHFYTGYIDEVKIYAAALTPAEIAIDMNGGAALNFGVLGDSEASLLDDGVAANPVAEWRFDEGTDNTCVGGTNDVCNLTGSGTNYDGTNSSATWVNSAKCYQGKCLEYNGSSSYVDVGTGPSTLNSISFWVNPATTTEYLLDLNGTAYLRVISGTITATGFTSPTIYVNGLEDGTLSANQWNHVAVTTGSSLNASDLDIGRVEGSDYFDGYIDSVKMYNTVLTRSQAAFEYNRGKPVAKYNFDECSGTDVYSSHTPHTTDFDGTLTVGATGTNTSSGSCSSGTSSEAWNNGTTGQFEASLDFDGTDDYVNLNFGPNYGTSDFTIAFWHKVDSVPTIHSLLSSVAESGTQDEAIAIKYHNTSCASGKILMQSRDTLSATTNNLCANTATNDGNWHHYVLVFDKTNSLKSIYIDGKFDTSAAVDSIDDGDMDFSSYPFYAGAQNNRGSANQFFNGQMDEIAFYNYALSAKQIERLYKNNEAAVSFGQ